MKKSYLTKAERLQFTLSTQLKEILIGLLLGDLCAHVQEKSVNARLHFAQGEVHKDYLSYLYNLFKMYCSAVPKVSKMLAHKQTGKRYSRVSFTTHTLPCFNELYELFYVDGKKVVPSNIADLITSLSLAYWICDDGSWNKQCKYVVLCTNSFTLVEVELLVAVLNNKWNLKCYVTKQSSGYVIIIPSYSVPILQELLASVMPPMMKHKIGL